MEDNKDLDITPEASHSNNFDLGHQLENHENSNEISSKSSLEENKDPSNNNEAAEGQTYSPDVKNDKSKEAEGERKNEDENSDDATSVSSSSSEEEESDDEDHPPEANPSNNIPATNGISSAKKCDDSKSGDEQNNQIEEERDVTAPASESVVDEGPWPPPAGENGQQNDPRQPLNESQNERDETLTNNQNEMKQRYKVPEVPEIPHDVPEANLDNALHGNNKYDETSSEEEDKGSALTSQQEEPLNDQMGGLAQSLKKALEQRDKEQQHTPIAALHFDDDDFASDIEDISLRARTADDFKIDPPPPALPPKMSIPPALPPKSKKNQKSHIHPSMYLNQDRTASLEPSRWSEDDDDDDDDDNKDESFPRAHKKKPLHPPPDRIIDFSQNLKKPKSRKGDNKSYQRHRDRSRRVVPSHQADDVFKRQAMISLHSSSEPHYNEGIDSYDSVHDNEEQDLNKLIQEANSLDIKPTYDPPETVDVLYPSYHKRASPSSPATNLTTSFPEVFKKLAPKQDTPVLPQKREPTNDFRAIPQGPFTERSRSLPRHRKPIPEKLLSYSRDPQDGDDEISLAESDFKFSPPPNEVPKSIDTTPYLCEVYPSDYTEFDTASDSDDKENIRKPASSLHRDVTPYDTVAEQDTDIDQLSKPNHLNPIVSEDYQICTNIDKNHHTFPRRMAKGKPKPKQRTNLSSMMAVPLTDPASKSMIQPSSLSYSSNMPLRRNKSISNMTSDSGPVSFLGQPPHIVVTRGPTVPDSFAAEPLSPHNGPRSLPVQKKSKPKTEPSAPKVHLSLAQKSNPNEEIPSILSPNSLQINVLPSDDPNVINLNIRTASSQAPKEEVTAREEPSPLVIRDPSPEPSPLIVQPLLPLTAISHREETPPTSQLPQSPPQHRVVDIEPIVIETLPVNPEPTPVIFSEPKIIMPTSVQPVQQQPAQPSEPVLPVPAPLPRQPVPTQETRVIEQPQPSVPNHVIVEVTRPTWEEKNRTLPSDMAETAVLMHAGDSGIDLTNYEGKRRSRRRMTSSSSDNSDYDARRRPSKKKLTKNTDASINAGLSDEYLEWYKEKYLKPTCCYLFWKHFIFALNLLFGVVGLALIGLGIWGFADLVSNGLNDSMRIIQDPIFLVFIVGLVLTLACLEGAIGFFSNNICMIKCFGWFLVVLCIIFVGGGIAFWILRETHVTPFVMSSFLRMIKEYNTTSAKISSFTVDQLQSNFQCCGVNGDSDWETNNRTFSCTNAVCSLPKSCCPPEQTIPCRRSITEPSRTGVMNCADAMPAWISANTPILVGVWLAVIVLFILNFVSIYFMVREILYLRLVHDKIMALKKDPAHEQTSEESSDGSSDSEYEEEKRKRRRRRKRRHRERRRKRAYINKGYR